MKISNLLFITMSAAACLGQAHADEIIPSIEDGPKKCHAWADSLKENTAYFEAAKRRCNAHEKCMANQSGNYDELHECIYQADNKFIRETEGASDGIQEVSAGLGGVVTTASPESDYYHPDRDKGFDFSKQE